MTPPKEVPIHGAQGIHRAPSYSMSVSPTNTFHSPAASFPQSFGALSHGEDTGKQLKPFETGDIKILLLENVNQSGRDILTGQGYQVEFLKTSLPEDELIEKIQSVFLQILRNDHTGANTIQRCACHWYSLKDKVD